MIKIPCEQGSPEWIQARLGIPTASQYNKILTPRKLEFSASATKYRNQLLVDWLMGEPSSEELWGFAARGHDVEDRARRYYEMQNDVDVELVGFILRDDRRTGASPDGLVGTEGGLEIKCPAAHTHVGYLLDSDGDEYKLQVQGNIWAAERDWWDFLSYHDMLPRLVRRVPRDETVIKALEAGVARFNQMLEHGKERLMAMGLTPKEKKVVAEFVEGTGDLPAWVWG